MKLLTCLIENVETACLFENDKVYPICRLDEKVKTMLDVIDRFDELESRLPSLLEGEGIPFDTVVKQAPIPYPNNDVLCLGQNYYEHKKESFKALNEKLDDSKLKYPVYFGKRCYKIMGDGEKVDGHFDFVEQLDYEVELAVVLKKDVYKVSEEEAYDAIFGYSVANDFSARDIQFRYGQWFVGKSLDTYLTMGPWIVTPDELDYPPTNPIHLWVNGELRQDDTTDNVLFSIARSISELSKGMHLSKGTIILEGTPSGVILGMEPKVWLKAGDVVKCEIEGIGTLTNEIE